MLHPSTHSVLHPSPPQSRCFLRGPWRSPTTGEKLERPPPELRDFPNDKNSSHKVRRDTSHRSDDRVVALMPAVVDSRLSPPTAQRTMSSLYLLVFIVEQNVVGIDVVARLLRYPNMGSSCVAVERSTAEVKRYQKHDFGHFWSLQERFSGKARLPISVF